MHRRHAVRVSKQRRPRGTGPSGRLTGTWAYRIMDRSPGPSRRPRFERHAYRTLPDLRPDPRPLRPRPWAVQSATQPGRCRRPRPPSGAPEENEHRTHDVPIRDHDLCRSCQHHAPASPPHHRRSRGESTVLPYQRVRQLPRRRPGDRGRDLPDLRLRPADALSAGPAGPIRNRTSPELVGEPERTTVRHPDLPNVAGEPTRCFVAPASLAPSA